MCIFLTSKILINAVLHCGDPHTFPFLIALLRKIVYIVFEYEKEKLKIKEVFIVVCVGILRLDPVEMTLEKDVAPVQYSKPMVASIEDIRNMLACVHQKAK